MVFIFGFIFAVVDRLQNDKFGTGIQKMTESYHGSGVEPVFAPAQQRRIAEALVKLERPQRLDRLPIPGRRQEPVIENAIRHIDPEEFQPGGRAEAYFSRSAAGAGHSL